MMNVLTEQMLLRYRDENIFYIPLHNGPQPQCSWKTHQQVRSLTFILYRAVCNVFYAIGLRFQ